MGNRLEAATEALGSVLALDPQRRISSLNEHLETCRQLLRVLCYRGSGTTQALEQKLAAAHSARTAGRPVMQILERLRAGESPVAIAARPAPSASAAPARTQPATGCAGMTGPAAGSAPEPAAETWTYGGIRATGAGLDLSGINSM
jgi:hypothetical protein